MSNQSRKPNYTLSAKIKSTGARSKVGVAWSQDDGSIQIILDAFVVLKGSAHHEAGEKVYITLYPPDWHKPEQPVQEAAPKGKPEDLEDDIPF